MFNWNEQYSVGIEEVDNQHKKFLVISDGVLELLNEEVEHNKIKIKAQELLRFAKWHFETEHFYMVEANFGLFNEHKEEHDEIISKINYFINDLEKFDTNFGTELMIFLKKWFLNHILKTDKLLYSCLIDNKIENIIIKDNSTL